MKHYILTGDGETHLVDEKAWADWFSTNAAAARFVAKTQVSTDVEVSTVFLGIDHQWGSGPPLLFETMIFGGEYDQCQWRWTTRVQALAGHDQIVTALRNGESPDGTR